MDIHKPKPIHGWRDFIKEIGIIVIGVSIALAAEQTLEWWHWRSQVRAAREVIATEMAQNMVFGIQRVRLARCLDSRLGAVAQILDTASRTGALPPVPDINIVRLRPWVSGAWQRMVASQVAAHFPRQQLAQLSGMYSAVDQTQYTNREELVAWTNLSAMVGPGRRLDPASEAELRKALSQARYYNRIVALIAGMMLNRAQAQDLPFSADDRRIIAQAATVPIDPSMCELSRAPAPSGYGQAPYDNAFFSAFPTLDEYQKHPPFRPSGEK